MRTKDRYNFLIRYFSDTMPVAESELNYTNAFELLVAVILSAQCTDKRINQITPRLFQAYPTPEAMAKAIESGRAIMATIKPATRSSISLLLV